MAAADSEAEGEAGIGCPAYAACDYDCARFARLGLDTEEEKRLGPDTEEEKRLALDMKRKERRKAFEKRLEKRLGLETEKEKRLVLDTEMANRLALDMLRDTEKEKRLALEKARLREKRKSSKKNRRRLMFKEGAGCGDDGCAEGRPKADMAVEYHHDQGAGRGGDDGRPDLEPLFDDAAAVAEHKSGMQKEQQRQQQDAHYMELRRARDAALDRIREFDSKTGKNYYSKLEYVDDIATFDHDEESPLGPMRYTEALFYGYGTTSDGEKKFISSETANFRSIHITSFSDVNSKDDNMRFGLNCSANVFSVKIVSSDVGFPIEVYGTVVARDDIDLKCVYLFHRDKDHCQLILSKDESLILTGPKRGLALRHHLYFEFDLKIKCAGRQEDEPLSKGYLSLNGIPYRQWQEVEVEREILDTKLSKVMMTYAVVQNAVEATVVIEVLQGRFYGEITGCTTGIRGSIVLHDSKLAEAMTNNGGVIQLLRNVVAVDMREKLIFTIVARSSDGKTKRTTIGFTPEVVGKEEKEITCGSIKMRVKVTWSIISRSYYHH